MGRGEPAMPIDDRRQNNLGEMGDVSRACAVAGEDDARLRHGRVPGDDRRRGGAEGEAEHVGGLLATKRARACDPALAAYGGQSIRTVRVRNLLL